MYLKKEILPKFTQWAESLKTAVAIGDAKRYAQYFINNTIDPSKVPSRGAVYDLFESLYEYYEMHKVLHAGRISPEEMLRIDNLHNLAYGVVWAMEHDAFDVVKYDPITHWGMDIKKASM